MRGKECYRLLLVSGFLASGLCVAGTDEVHAPDPFPLMVEYPRCVDQRLGQVEVTLGTKTPNPRTPMPPHGVSFREALDGLVEAARAKGGTAVIIRHEEAIYYNKGGRRARRPMYLSMRGAVVVLDESKRKTCRLELIDPVVYEHEANKRIRKNVIRDTGSGI